MITKKTDKISLSTLVKELDGLFSEWLRRSNSINGKCSCFICGHTARWQDMQAGHYVDRMHMTCRFDVNNVYVVCEQCNCFDPDHKDKFRAAIIQKCGENIITILEAGKHFLRKFMRFELEELKSAMKVELKKMKS